MSFHVGSVMGNSESGAGRGGRSPRLMRTNMTGERSRLNAMHRETTLYNIVSLVAQRCTRRSFANLVECDTKCVNIRCEGQLWTITGRLRIISLVLDNDRVEQLWSHSSYCSSAW